MHYRFFQSLVKITLIGLLALSGHASSGARPGGTTVSQEPEFVSMVSLLSTPHLYEGHFVRVIGFLGIEFENDALYLHQEDYRYSISKNSLALRLSESERAKFKDLNSHYVVLEARMYANGPEAAGMWSGALGKITRLEAWRSDREANPPKKSIP
jgi:hypothetical protein